MNGAKASYHHQYEHQTTSMDVAAGLPGLGLLSAAYASNGGGGGGVYASVGGAGSSPPSQGPPTGTGSFLATSTSHAHDEVRGQPVLRGAC